MLCPSHSSFVDDSGWFHGFRNISNRRLKYFSNSSSVFGSIILQSINISHKFRSFTKSLIFTFANLHIVFPTSVFICTYIFISSNPLFSFSNFHIGFHLQIGFPTSSNLFFLSHRSRCYKPRTPRCLEIKSSRHCINIQHLACKVKPFHLFTFHGFEINIVE
ncbi:hypothetical protein BH11BAC1_BH11BAC1_26230 [soil metagenome]